LSAPRSRQIAKLPSHTMPNQTLGSIATHRPLQTMRPQQKEFGM
jgi:hypothetical protein